MVKVGIIGSCVTRDAFELEDCGFDVKGSYFPRASIISLMSPPIITTSLQLNTDQQWIKWVLTNDHNKSTLSQLQQKQPKIICIDLIEERYDVISFANSYLTRSDELLKYHNDINTIQKDNLIKRGSEQAEELFYEKALSFCDKINSNHPDTLVVIHRATYCNYYRENGRIIKFAEKKCFSNSLINSRLELYYELLASKLKNVTSIRVDEQLTLSCKHHKWGVSPFHYIDEYYQDFIKQLQLISQKYHIAEE